MGRRFVSGLFRVITTIEKVTLTWSIIGIAALTIANVFARMFGSSVAFAEELSMFLIILATFMGLGYAAAEARHIRMTALYDLLPLKARKLVALLISLSTAALLFGLTWLSIDYIIGTVRELGTVSPVLQIPLWIAYLVVPLGLFLAGIQYLLAFAKNLLDREKVYVSFDHTDDYDSPPAADI